MCLKSVEIADLGNGEKFELNDKINFEEHYLLHTCLLTVRNIQLLRI